MRVLVSGPVANKPGHGGAAWTWMSSVLGFRRLGLDVVFVEQIEHPTPEAVVWFDSVTDRFGLAGRAALLFDGRVHGVDWEELVALAQEAELLLNYSGHLTAEPLKDAPRVKAYLDLDPGFTQVWHASGIAGARLEGHDVFFTVGLNIGDSRSSIPTGGIDWRPLPPPVVLEEWPATPDGQPDRFTTVATWRGPYGVVEWEGRTLQLKVHEFRKVVQLPRLAPQSFELALDIHPGDEADRVLLEGNGWRLVDPRAVAGTPDDFRAYVQGSWAEFSVAQGIYVETESGWLSDRTTRYLASGKPALVQDTGAGAHVAAGEGLVAFADLAGAVAGAGRIARDYEAHAAAARAIAEEHFDSDKVLVRLLEECGLG